MNYNHKTIEEKWEKIWEERGVNYVDLVNAKRPFYNLMMFPYPSAEGLHVGNMYAFTGADVYGRSMKMRGFDVFEPMGLDGFGIHSENYALKVNKHPIEQAKISEERFYKQLKRIGNIFDWKHTVETYDPDYYKWTQWIFIKLFKAGLVERKKAPVNFCTSCKTVLADEQVVAGECERCGSVVEKRDLEQWFIKITKYAEKLLSNLDKIDWTEKVKTAQRLWIGKKEGANIKFKITNNKSITNEQISNDKFIEVFTTKPETLLGATFLVLSPENEIVASLLNSKFKNQNSKIIQEYVDNAKKKTSEERISEKRKKTGVFTGLYAINPANNEKIPVWVADYVLSEYGTGAIMGVPGGDERDLEFAKTYNLPVINYPEYKGELKKVVTYHLRDWLVSRQRYWGAPIPMVYCARCANEGIGYENSKLKTQNSKLQLKTQNWERNEMAGWFPVNESDLPVLLPNVKDWRPKGTGRGPLSGVPEFVHTKCPKCGGEAERETDVFDTFLDSSWYFLRYPSVGLQDNRTTVNSQDEVPWDEEITKKWLPVNIYIGGAEHSVLHLMYSRFITMALHDLGYLEFEEPFTKFFAHGLIIKEGAKMSKSKGNIVNPDEYIEKFGADTLRTYLMFIGPFSEGGDFRNFGVAGVYRFLNRVWNWANKNAGKQDNSEQSRRKINKLIKGVTEDLEKLRYNTAIAKLMEFLNFAVKNECDGETVKTYLKLLAPFAPHITEELYHRILGFQDDSEQSNSKITRGQETVNSQYKSIHRESWPEWDEEAVVEERVTVVIQVNGKVRGKIIVNSEQSKDQDFVEKMAREDDKVKPYLAGGVKKTIFVPGKLVNFVV